jgi:hypothetical protein
VAAFVPANQGLRLASHYLNATQNDIMATVQLIMRRAAPGTVTNRAGIFFFNNVQILIPPGGPTTLSKTCTAPQDMTLLYSTGHMHQHATNLTALLNNQNIYETNMWDSSPFQKYAPPVQVKKGDTFTFSCTWQNNTGVPLTFGESALTNEMCIFDGQYYPNPTGQGINCM